MKFDRIKQSKKPNPKRGIVLVLVLFLIIYLFFNMEEIMNALFN